MTAEATRGQSSYVCGASTSTLIGRCIGQVLDDTAEHYPERDALVVKHENRRFTYRQLKTEIDLAARGFLSLGIKKGDRIGIWSTNSSEWVITQFATAKIGAILVNINPLNRAFELKHVLRQSECQTLLMIDGFRDANYVPILREICPEIGSSAPGSLQSENLPDLRTIVFLGETVTPGMFSWEDLLRRGQTISLDELRQRESELEFDGPINIQYTSGTTGLPKGAMLSHHNIVNNAQFIAAALRLSPQDRLCIPVPFYHCFGMVLGNMACVVSGATMVVPAAYFDPEATLRAIHEEKCTALHGVPTMFIAELSCPNFKDFDLSSLRTGIMSGSPCPIEVMRRVVKEMNCQELTIAYGQTEASPVITQTTTADPIEVRVTTVGKAMPHTEVKIIDPLTGKIVPRGTAGELCTRGYLVMKGYYRNPEATRKAIDDDGWLRTGDLAVLDDCGYFKIVGRSKDMVIRGGENIYPREIEEFLFSCPRILDVQIVGVPDLKYGEALAAWVKLKPGEALTLEDLKQFCKGKIAEYKIPRYLKVTSDFPMTVSGKIQKFKMREISIQEFGLQQAAKTETA
jgi:fatty-acyl-CoA synthase